MTLFFNFENLVKETDNNPIKLTSLLREYANPHKLLKNNLRSKLRGHNFLLNPDYILEDRVTDVLYIYQYILLASKRNYAAYQLYGIKYLPLSHFPDLNLDSIKTNPLLKITQTEVQFKYEEAKWH
jgi:hypothetical protein